MTYLPRYEIKCAGKHNQRGLTLYEACKALAAARDARGTALHDSTHIACAGRCVGFYSEWHHVTWPMYGATPEERELILAWA